MGLFGRSGPEQWKPTNRLTQYFAEAKKEGRSEPEAEFAPRPLFLDHEAMEEQASKEREKKSNTRIIAVAAMVILGIVGVTHEAIMEKLSPKNYRVGPRDKEGPTNLSVSATPNSTQDLRNTIYEQKEALDAQRLYIEFLRRQNAALSEEIRRLGGKTEAVDFKEFLGRPDEEPADPAPKSRQPSTEELRAKFRHQE